MPPISSSNSWIPLLSGHTAGRTSRVWALIFPLFFVLATCSAGPKPKPDESPSTEPAIEPSDEDDQLKFDRAREALEAGDYAEAKETFRLIQSEKGSGEVAQLAEMYIARAELGSLDAISETESDRSKAGLERGARMLQSMADDENVDARVRHAAGLYEGYVRLELEDDRRFRSIFSVIDGTSLGSTVLEGDRLRLWPVLIEGLRAAGRHADAIDASAGLFDAVEETRPEKKRSSDADVVAPAPSDGEANEQTPGNGGKTDESGSEEMSERRAELAAFARNRGFASAGELDDEVLAERLEADDGFVRAVTGWTYLDRALESEEIEAEEREELDERFAEVGADLNAIGASKRVSELSIKMATTGGSKRLVIGALLPLSGQNTSIGQRALSGMLLAMRAFRNEGPARVTLVVEDSNADAEKVWSRLAALEPAAVVGPLDPNRAADFAPEAQAREVPMIALTARRPTDRAETTEPYAVRNFMDPVTEARASANLAFHEFGDRRAAIVYPTNGYGETLRGAFEEEFRRLGGQIVEKIGYDRSRSNYSHVADRLAGANVDAVFMPDSGSKVAEVSAFIADRDIWGMAPGADKSSGGGRTYVHYLGTSLWYGPILKRQAASYVQGAVIPTWFAPEFADQPTRQFSRRFDVVYGREPGNTEAFAYDNVRWVRRLMVDHGVQTPAALRTSLLGGNPYDGATGRGSFDADGTLWRTVRFVSVSDESYEPLDLQVDIAPAGDDAEADRPDQPADGSDGEGRDSPTP